MKRVFFLFLVPIFFFLSCAQILPADTNSTIDDTQIPGKKFVKISLESDYARTALPTVDWSDFTFNLTATQNPGEASQKDPVTIFEDRVYTGLVKGFELDEGKYKFTLDAYKNGAKSLSGDLIFDLSLGDSNLSFKIFPVSGSIGSALVKITFPMDGPVASVVAGVSSDIFTSVDSIETSELPIKIVSGKKVVTLDKKNLPSKTEQYAIFWFYDSNGSLVYSGSESLIITGGLVSTSEFELTAEDWHTYLCTVSLYKNGEGWASSRKSVSLVDKSNPLKIYNLKDTSGGKFTGSVAEGLYYVYVNGLSTDIEFESVNKNVDVNYFTVNMDPSKNCKMVCVDGGIDVEDNFAVVQENCNFTYKIVLSNGYEEDNDGIAITQNEVPVLNPAFDQNFTISPVDCSYKISVSGIVPITYSITYKDSNGNNIFAYSEKSDSTAYWIDVQSDDYSYIAPTSFTAESDVELPTIANVRKAGNYFDAWVNAEGVAIKSTANIFNDIVVNATWKKAPTVDEENKIIYANGFNLLITGDTSTTNDKTYVYVDLKGDGIFNEDEDWQILCTNISTGLENDFTGFELSAGSFDGSEILSDFTFTITGGIISSIYGLDSIDVKHSNKSTLNISGTAVIGSVINQETVTNLDSTKTTTATEVKGIMLETLSDERVNIVGKMINGTRGGEKQNYKITCITPYTFDSENEHIISYISNSNYATFSYVTCWTDTNPDELESSLPRYEKCLLAQKNVYQNGVQRTLIRIADDGGVVLPKAAEVSFDELGEFSLGQEIVTTKCSVFSIAVDKGTFRLNSRLTITENSSDSDKAVEETLTYMAQPTEVTYVESFSFDQTYVYMQIISRGNQLTPEIASDFMSQLYFKRNDPEVPLKVTINLETVPSELIEGNTDGQNGSEFKYFNGSFYKRVPIEEVETPTVILNDTDKKKNGKYFWYAAYDSAKNLEFNGLQGYLMNITSLVENNYIYDTFYKLYPDKLSWAGGSVWVPKQTMDDGSGNKIPVFDQDVYPITNKYSKDKWIWQAGPEAGLVFFNTPVCMNAQQAIDGVVEGVFNRWNNAKYLYPDDWTSDIEDTSYPLRGQDGSEPNSSSGTAYGTNWTSSEPCLQFLAGKLTPSGKKPYYANGYWNNLNYNTDSGDYKSTGYIVEFTPYETIYGIQTANYQAIKRTATY